MTAPPQIVVAGAGILGASIAYFLSRANARVLVVDAGDPAARATSGSFAWINAHSPTDPDYFALRLASIAGWRRLGEALQGLPLRLSGGLLWEQSADEIGGVCEALADAGYPARLVESGEIQRMEPAIGPAPPLAIDAAAEGVVEPDKIAGALLDAAKELGADYRTGRIRGVETRSGRVTGLRLDDGVVNADRIVLALGVGAAPLLAALDIGLPMDNQPGMLVRTGPAPRLTERVLVGPDLHLWQMADDRLIAAEDFGGSPVDDRAATLAREVLDKVEALFPDIGPLHPDGMTTATRPKPADGRPVLGAVGPEGLFTAVTHSGVTLAPAIGEMLAAEVLKDAQAPLFAPYRIQRFAKA